MMKHISFESVWDFHSSKSFPWIMWRSMLGWIMKRKKQSCRWKSKLEQVKIHAWVIHAQSDVRHTSTGWIDSLRTMLPLTKQLSEKWDYCTYSVCSGPVINLVRIKWGLNLFKSYIFKTYDFGKQSFFNIQLSLENRDLNMKRSVGISKGAENGQGEQCKSFRETFGSGSR